MSVTDNEMICITEGFEEFLETLRVFLAPHTYDEAFFLVNQKCYINQDFFKEIFETMRCNNLLKEYEQDTNILLSPYHLEKYKRQISSLNSLNGVERNDAMEMQKNICNTKVCIIGLGGTGSHLALSLISIGVENLLIVDFDNIELSNTARQVLYNEDDIGRNKIDVAVEKLLKYNSKANIVALNRHIQELGDLDFLENHEIDLLVLCADTPRGKIQYIVDQATQNSGVPWMSYGPYHHSKIAIGPYIIPGETKSFTELFSDAELTEDFRTEEINEKFVGSICDPYNAFASQFVAIEIFKILSGYRQTVLRNKRCYIDTDNWEMEFVNYETER